MTRFKHTLLFLLPLALILSCEDKPDIDTPEPKPSSRIWWVNTDVNDYSHSEIKYGGDGRPISFTGTAGDYLVFYKDDTIHHILEPRSSFNSLFSRRSWVFVYRDDGKLSKVYVKSREDYDDRLFLDNDPYWGNESDGQAVLKDSLIYSATGQITEIHDLPFKTVTKLEYDSAKSVVPSRIYDHTLGQVATTTLYYYDLDQPGVNDLWFFAFTNVRLPAMPTMPPTACSRYAVLLKKCVKNFTYEEPNGSYISPVFVYSYNSDSTIFSGRPEPDQLSYHFSYSFREE